MPSASIVTLACGCFFEGREFHPASDCEEHSDGEDTACCDACGKRFPIDELDGKPTINSKLRRTRQREGQLMMLYRAAVRGYDFDRLECRSCYGPGYLASP